MKLKIFYSITFLFFAANCLGQCVSEQIILPKKRTINTDKPLSIETQGVRSYKFLVYNHWGEELYAEDVQVQGASSRGTSVSEINWNTKGLKKGIYIVSVEAVCLNKEKTRKGGNISLEN